jgi:cysteine desulfurase
MPRSVYLDNNATTPLKPEVLELMAAVLAETGNAVALHGAGRRARAHVETAREQVAALAGVNANQVVFNSGATEANNSVLHAFAGQRILMSAIEHPSLTQAAPEAELIPVTADGLPDMAAFEKMLEAETPPALICLMLVNNEIGTIFPVAEMARLAKKKHPNVFIHVDAVQAPGRMKVDFPALYADYMVLSAHKIGGPQGVGALISAPGAKPARFIYGGGQERNLRAGTVNVAGIAGFGLAASRAPGDLETAAPRIKALRDRLERELLADNGETVIFGQNAPRVGNTCAVGVPCIPAQNLLMGLDLAGIAISTGSACSSGTVKTSHVLKALRPDDHDDIAAFRISLGWKTEEGEIDYFIAEWRKLLARVRANGDKTPA